MNYKFEHKRRNQRSHNITKRQLAQPLPKFPIFMPKPNLKSVIPLNIFQTWHTKDLTNTPLMKANCELLKKVNPEFKYYLFDDNDCRKYIAHYFNKDVVFALDSLIPGAYKADLWRYCVLYISGGIYLDIKYKCINNFKLIALTDKEYVVRDRPFLDGIYNGLIVSMPKNPILLKCIISIVINVKTHYYGLSPLSPTGPELFAKFYTEKEKSEMELQFKDIVLDLLGITHNGIPILIWYHKYREEQEKTQLTKHYSDMWTNRQIYRNPVMIQKIHKDQFKIKM